jgi:iron complex outermembrane recepter protein
METNLYWIISQGIRTLRSPRGAYTGDSVHATAENYESGGGGGTMDSSRRWTTSPVADPAAFAFRAMRLIGSLMMVAVAWTAAVSSARAETEATSEVSTDSADTALTEIIVTARKRVETMQSIPESIEAFGAQEIADAHITKIDDLGNLVSNLNITTRADNTPDVVLRGVGSFGVVSGVGFYANDVQLFDGQTVRAEDIERIEVLKGPQGTLYGGSNIGGAIKYVTKLPTDTFQAGAGLEFGNYGTQTYTAYVSGPLVPNVLEARASFFDSHTDGYIYDTALNRTVDGGSERGGRVTFLYKGEETTATLYLNYNWTNAGVGANLYYRPDSPTNYSLQIADGTQPEYLRGLYSVALKLDHELNDNLTLTSISSYFHSYADVTVDIDKGPLPLLTGYQRFRTEVGSEELRLASTGDTAFKWLFGLFAQVHDPRVFTDTRSFNGNPGDPASLNDPAQYSVQPTNVVQKHREYAAFGNASYDWRQWTFEAGLRADYNNSSLTDSEYGIGNKQHGTEILPKFTASYHVDKDVMGYATISRGFQPGDLVEQFDASGNPFAASYKAETTWNYELGLKSTLFDRVRLNAAVFYIDYQNRLFQTVALQANQFVQVTQNIGASHNYGGEFDVSTRLTRELLLAASFGVTKAIWGNVPYFDADLNQATNLNGRTAPYAPDYQGSVSLDWSHHLTDSLVFGARVDSTFVGRQYWDPTDHYRQPAHQLVNLGLRVEGEKWSIAGHVSNVFNKLYNTEFVSAAEVQAPFNVAGIGRPRLWTVALNYRW